MSEPPPAPERSKWPTSIALFALTLLSTTYVGSVMFAVPGDRGITAGFAFSLPLMTILLAHELGHYIAALIHRVPASPPYFIPLPLPPLGTMGAIILMPGRIARRDALLDIGAAGPLAGMVIAIPVLIYGIGQSPIEAIQPNLQYLVEGKSILYLGLIYALKGPIPDGHDIMLSPAAFAGWTGLLVTMINLIPAMQLDGGHVARALFGERHERISKMVRRLLLPLAAVVSVGYGVPAFLEGVRGQALSAQFWSGMPWVVWWGLLRLMARRAPFEHPPTDPGPLSPRRRHIAAFTLALFLLLFMPAWLREVHT